MGFPGGSMIKNTPANARDVDFIPGWADPLEQEMATHASTLPGKSHGQEEPGRL